MIIPILPLNLAFVPIEVFADVPYFSYHQIFSKKITNWRSFSRNFVTANKKGFQTFSSFLDNRIHGRTGT